MAGFRYAAYALLAVFLLFSCAKKAGVRPSGPFDPEKAFEKANEELSKEDYEGARATLNEIKSKDLTRKYAPLAQLRIADSYVSEDEPETAVSEFEEFLKMYPNHKYAPYALYQKAMAYYNRIESPERGYGAAVKALGELQRLKAVYPRNPYRDTLDLKIERCVNTIAEYEMLVGRFYLGKKAYKGALRRFQGILLNLPDFRRKDEVFFDMALAYEGIGEIAEAEKYLRLVQENYPDKKIAKEAEEKLQDLGNQGGR